MEDSIMSIKLGMDAKLYFCAAGIGGTPTWTELTNVKNVSLSLQTGEADVTTRGNHGWKATAATMKEGSIEFEMVWDTADTGFTAIQTAYFGNTKIGLAAMDGDVATVGSQGLWADCSITNFSREEPLEEAITVKVTAKPTYSTSAPEWKKISGS
jgi:hypothetical protein